MKVAIAFTVYGDYKQDYTEALNVLNEEVAKSIENGEFEFTYGDTPIKPILPLKKEDCGNIVPYNEDTYEPAHWEDVTFVFNIDENIQDFDIHKMRYIDYPFNFWEPRAVYAKE